MVVVIYITKVVNTKPLHGIQTGSPLVVTLGQQYMFGLSIQVHAFLVCLATEWVQQFHSASAASLITSRVPNLLFTHARPSPICSLSAAVPRDWEKLRSIGIELKAHHRQRRL